MIRRYSADPHGRSLRDGHSIEIERILEHAEEVLLASGRFLHQLSRADRADKRSIAESRLFLKQAKSLG